MGVVTEMYANVRGLAGVDAAEMPQVSSREVRAPGT
jgi:hypothetical protein